jgi:DNA repair exonuclease SbcCD ATPase subunit
MPRWWLALVLTVVSTTAWAQPASEPGARSEDPRLVATTHSAQETAAAIQRRVRDLGTQRNALRQRLDDQLATVDRLKRGPRGWRTKTQLEERQAELNETQKQYEIVDGQLAAANSQLGAARARLVAAIDAELAAGVSDRRGRTLRTLRDELTPRRAARRIVLPDTKIDPGLDPEELQEQAAAIREGEQELERQIKGLEQQADELQRVHDLRQQHARTHELDQRDDNTSRRNPQQPRTGDRAGGGSSESIVPNSGGPAELKDLPAMMYETDAHIVLPEVVDPAILDGIQSAYRSGDHRQRAEAVRKARDAVAARLKHLRQQRGRIEGLAKQRR